MERDTKNEAMGLREIPLLGTVAAGRPLEMFEVEDNLTVPEALWNGRRVFALRVRGSSMIEAGIHDGDCVLVEPRETVDDGRIVVAEIDGCATVKKFYRGAGGHVRLQPANPDMLPLVVPGDNVKILGVVVGVLRKYGFKNAVATAPRPSTQQPRPTRPAVSTPPVRVPSVPAAVPPKRAFRDESTLDLALNAIDSYLERWNAALARDHARARGRHELRMAELGRDLQALREWCGRTSKASLRHAMIVEANKLMQRMERFLSNRDIELPLAG